MIIEGTIEKLIDSTSGISKTTGNPWMKNRYLIAWTDHGVNKKLAFDVFGEDRIKMYGIAPGKKMKVQVDVTSREYNGNYYTDVRCYDAREVVANGVGASEASNEANAGAETAQPSANAGEPAGQPSNEAKGDAKEKESDLPF